jgi:predicted small metal-binding protein
MPSLAMKWRNQMAKKVQCDCGFVAKADDDETLIDVVQKHAKEVHNMDLTREQVLAMAKSE